jgi:protein-S-isoprenylcysteine O-methyltransferase Ste14
MKKIISAIYGVIAYLIFLVAFFYAIGFVGNLNVPKSIDSGTETTFLTALIVNVFLLSIFAIQHSVMARPAFKKWLNGILSPAIERSTYVLLSSLTLFLIYWQWHPITTVIWEVENNTMAKILTGVFFFGWSLVLFSTFLINHFEVFGLKQVFDNLSNKFTENPKFKVKFLYKIVRHPIMLGYIIAFWSTPLMTLGHLIFAVITTLYIIVAVKYFEEKDLKKSIGKAYEDYQNKVPMIVPFTKRRK